jgi:hypothetical protein
MAEDGDQDAGVPLAFRLPSSITPSFATNAGVRLGRVPAIVVFLGLLVTASTSDSENRRVSMTLASCLASALLPWKVHFAEK